MAKKTKRTQVKNLAVAEQELTPQEQEKIQGGKKYAESRSNVAIAAAPTSDAGTQASPTAAERRTHPL